MIRVVLTTCNIVLYCWGRAISMHIHSYGCQCVVCNINVFIIVKIGTDSNARLYSMICCCKFVMVYFTSRTLMIVFFRISSHYLDWISRDIWYPHQCKLFRFYDSFKIPLLGYIALYNKQPSAKRRALNKKYSRACRWYIQGIQMALRLGGTSDMTANLGKCCPSFQDHSDWLYSVSERWLSSWEV